MGILKKSNKTLFFTPYPMLSYRSLCKKFFDRVLSGKKFLFFIRSYVVSIYICPSPSLSFSLSFISTVAPKPNHGVCLIPQYPKFTQLQTSDWPDSACVRECVWLCVFSFFSPGKIISFISKPNIARRLSVFALESRRRDIMTIPDCLHMKYIYPQSANLTNYL